MLLVTAVLAVFTAGPAAADTAGSTGQAFPSGCDPGFGSAAWDGAEAIIFCGGSTQIVKYTPATNSVQVMNAQLPTLRSYTSAVWIGNFAYIFGGAFNGRYYGDVLRYDPVSDTTPTVVASLVSQGWGTVHSASAITDGSAAYIMGGSYNGGPCSNLVLIFSPSSPNFIYEAGTLPTGLCGTSAVYDGQREAFIFGGYDSATSTHYSNQVIRVGLGGVGNGPLGQAAGILPSARDHTSAIWDGMYAYVFGGEVSNNPVNEILR